MSTEQEVKKAEAIVSKFIGTIIRGSIHFPKANRDGYQRGIVAVLSPWDYATPRLRDVFKAPAPEQLVGTAREVFRLCLDFGLQPKITGGPTTIDATWRPEEAAKRFGEIIFVYEARETERADELVCCLIADDIARSLSSGQGGRDRYRYSSVMRLWESEGDYVLPWHLLTPRPEHLLGVARKVYDLCREYGLQPEIRSNRIGVRWRPNEVAHLCTERVMAKGKEVMERRRLSSSDWGNPAAACLAATAAICSPPCASC